MDVLVKSWNLLSCLSGGVMPSHCIAANVEHELPDPGEPIAGGWTFEFSGLKGDLEWKRDVNNSMETGIDNP